MNIRDCTIDDVPWIAAQAKIVFGPLVAGYDESGAFGWIDHCVRCDTTITVRGPGVVAFADVIAFPWAPGILECDLMHLFGASTDAFATEAMAVGRAVRDRAVAMGCRHFYIGSAFRDLTPIGRRLGGSALPPVYRLDLAHVQ
jgi:hypothetical protein